MKILYLTARQPYPYIKGDQLISYNQIKELSKRHKVYLVSFYENQLNELDKEMSKYCEEIYLFNSNKLSKIISSLKVFYNGKSIQANMFYMKKIRDIIDKLYNEIKPDIVHVLSFRMAEYFIDKKTKKSITLVDAYSLNMRLRRDKCKNILKLLWHTEYLLLKKYENKVLNKYDIKTIVAERDKKYLLNENIIVNPIGVNLDYNFLHECKQKYRDKEVSNNYTNIIFQGNMSYFPNIKAIKFLVNEIMPKLNRRIRLFLVGGQVSKEIQILKNSDIIITGYVDKIEQYLAIADIAIYPIFEATGMQNKVLEALAAQIPCITTDQCLTGIKGLKHKENILIANTVDEFVNCFKLLENNDKLLYQMKNNGYKLIQREYSWDRNVTQLEELWGEYNYENGN
ncbi:glycosyltransferase family 4 protein [Vallitalea okinawensis]|uniref:glycosyltransferase family 4 protein n=1 Tax=Vallitalea okinawensis TaxID=2078660 RepID=UPI000CFC7F1E|nr:glycosyltransferase family 4 protein [Vallitalea okinawensis]